MSTLTYQEAILQQMHTRALRGVAAALVLSALLHGAITLIQLGGESFGFRSTPQNLLGDEPLSSQQKSDSFRAQIQPRARPIEPPAPPPALPTPPPVDRSVMTVQTRVPNVVPTPEVVPIVPAPALELPTVKTDLPALPPSPTKQFEVSNATQRIERQAVNAVPRAAPVPPLDLAPVPPLEITPPKREPIEPKAAQTAAPKPEATPAAAPTPEPAKAASEPPKAAAAEPPKAVTAEPPKAPISEPQNAAAPATAQPQALTPTPQPAAAAAPNPTPPQITTAAPTPLPAAPSAPSGSSAPSTASGAAAAGASAATGGGAPPSGSRGATVTLPGSGSGSSAPSSGAASSAGPGDSLKPGFIDGFDPDAARRNAARNAARDLNARRALVPPSVAPSPTAREREAKAIENAIREDCVEAGKEKGLLNLPSVVGGVLFDKGCRIR